MNASRFPAFLEAVDDALVTAPAEDALLERVDAALAALIAHDDWLPPACAQADATRYRQYLLHVDAAARYSVVSFVWGPGQGTPIHNHTVWGLIGVLRGAELCTEYAAPGAGALVRQRQHRLERGAIDRVSPTIGDWHAVHNALTEAPSISIHVYGGDIGRIERSLWDEATRSVRPFVSGYANDRPWFAPHEAAR